MSSQLRSCMHTRVRAARPASLGRASVPACASGHTTRLPRPGCASASPAAPHAPLWPLWTLRRVIAARRCASLAPGPVGSPARGPRFYLNCLTYPAING
jgi:hypothetical protein